MRKIDPPVILRMPPFPPETGTLLSASQTFFAPQTGTPSSLRDTPSNRGNYLTGEFPFKGAKKRDSGVKKSGHGKPCPYGNTRTGRKNRDGQRIVGRNSAFCILHSAFNFTHPTSLRSAALSQERAFDAFPGGQEWIASHELATPLDARRAPFRIAH